ncbi:MULTISPECIES: helix-turn-helix domain-containing protein [Streptomyces]|uniref:XRE family transcriptional regulator n=1 Tax=Streptomyces albus TaxID=1888 RepID=A0A8H1QNA5_9ACTN|nr:MULTISPECIES: helix-turn-helix transcriptional regulator [Streptomyces]TGG80411.1 XRE family transcriptional regulator [Streptomyces albus]UVN54355.1 helix-turn-helix domain-containing protein [Streptomyces albus]
MPTRRAVTGRSREPRARFAEELRSLRTRRGESLRQLGERLGWDWSLFGKMEKGETLGGPEVVQALDTHYGTPGLLLALWELAINDQTQFRERYRRYMALEAQATSLWHFAVSVLPGLLQTPGYAREVLAAGGLKGDELEQQVQARMGRRALLEGDDAPPFRTILSEAVLRTPLRDAGEWRAQLEYVGEAAERENVVVQVLPFRAGFHGLMNADMWYLRLPSGRTVAYTESGYRGHLIEETVAVERLQFSFDAVRDLALSPSESRKFMLRVLEEVPCAPST